MYATISWATAATRWKIKTADRALRFNDHVPFSAIRRGESKRRDVGHESRHSTLRIGKSC